MGNNMKYLIRGPFFLESNGYAAALKDHLYIFDKVFNEEIYLENFKSLDEEEKIILELEHQIYQRCISNKEDNFDVTINYLAPNVAKPKKNSYNIIFFYWESNLLPGHNQNLFPQPEHNNWIHLLENYNEIWTACNYSRDAILRSGVNKHIEVIPWPILNYYINNQYTFCDSIWYRINGDKRSFNNIKNNHKMIFLTIGEFQPRKNLQQLVQNFVLEFINQDDVALVIKTTDKGISNLDDVDNYQLLSDYINNYIHELNIGNESIPPIYFTIEFLSDMQMKTLYRESTFYISLSHSEGMGGGIIQAMANKLPPISAHYSAMTDYLNESNSMKVDHYEDFIHSMTSVHYDSGQQWSYIKDLDIQKVLSKLKSLNQNKDEYNKLKEHAYNSIINYCGEDRVFEIMHEVLGRMISRVKKARVFI